MSTKRKTNSKYIATLEPCHHTVRFDPPPQMGDEVWCIRCDAPRRVSSTVAEWGIVCAEKDCRMSRSYGADRTSAERAAHAHATRFDHDVFVSEGSRTRQRVSPHGEQYTIPQRQDNTFNVYRWLESNRDHAQSLRRLGSSVPDSETG